MISVRVLIEFAMIKSMMMKTQILRSNHNSLFRGTFVAHPYRMVPTASGHSFSLLRTLVACSMSTSTTVMNRNFLGKFFFTNIAVCNILVGNPVIWSSRIFNPTWRNKKKVKEFNFILAVRTQGIAVALLCDRFQDLPNE